MLNHLVEARLVDLIAGIPELMLDSVDRLQPRAAGGELLDLRLHPVVDAPPLSPPACPVPAPLIDPDRAAVASLTAVMFVCVNG